MIKKIRIMLAISLALTALTPNTSFAYPLFKNSKILKDLGAQILVGEGQHDAIVFDKDVLKEYHVPTDGTETYLITSKGLLPMEGKTTTKDLLEMCADPYPGIGFPKENGDGIFIATGKNIVGSISWFPARVSNNDNSNCFKKLSANNPIFTSYESSLPKGIIRQARWKRKLSREEIELNCKNYAESNEQYSQQSLVRNLYKECMEGEWTCRDEERLVVTFEENDVCKEITNSSIDCIGPASFREDLREFLGSLKIQKGDSQEIWLIWNAPGYEGDGVYTIEIKDLGKKIRPSEEWLVYNGC